MGKRIEYVCGQEVGGNGFIFLEETEPRRYRKNGTKMKSSRRRAKFLCPVCGEEVEMDITPIKIGRTKMCVKCANKLHAKNNTETFQIGQQIGNNGITFLEELGWTNGHRKVKVKCPSCGEPFDAFLDNLKRNHTKCCLSCSRKQQVRRDMSKGAAKIKELLDYLGIEYNIEHTFPDCYGYSNKKKLPFDFYLPEYNICIEFDGEQHFRSVEYFGGEKNLKKIQYHDFLKNVYCESNGIGILRIFYSEENNLSPDKLMFFIQEAVGGHLIVYSDFIYNYLHDTKLSEYDYYNFSDLTYDEVKQNSDIKAAFSLLD